MGVVFFFWGAICDSFVFYLGRERRCWCGRIRRTTWNPCEFILSSYVSLLFFVYLFLILFSTSFFFIKFRWKNFSCIENIVDLFWLIRHQTSAWTNKILVWFLGIYQLLFCEVFTVELHSGNFALKSLPCHFHDLFQPSLQISSLLTFLSGLSGLHQVETF